MLNHKQITRKKSQKHFITKENGQTLEEPFKKKKSISNFVASTKINKQTDKDIKKQSKKLKQQKKLVHSHSKGKLNKKHLKSERSQKIDENFNCLNHKKSAQKLTTLKHTKQSKAKVNSEYQQQAHQDQNRKHIHTQTGCLSKTKSQSKINKPKILSKKKLLSKESKQMTQSKTLLKKYQKKKSSIQFHNKALQTKKYFPTKVDNGKSLIQTRNKFKKKSSTSSIYQSQKPLSKPKIKCKKISQLIQKSILYSQVNFDFKEQISFLVGSSIKQKQQFFLPFQLNVNQDSINNQENKNILRQHKAAIIIQKHFRGYIQRKYIQEAKYIIDCIKKIQRFWRLCLEKKKVKSIMPTQKQQKSCSLITIKDLNQNGKSLKSSLQNNQAKKGNEIQQSNKFSKNNLKQIIKNILNEDGLNETIKQKIRKAMVSDSQQEKKQFPNNIQCQQDFNKKISQSKNFDQCILQPLLPIKKSSKSQKSISQLSLNIEQQQKPNYNLPKNYYIQKKIDMQITSQKNFNSPMSNSSHSLISPGIKKMISPKCLSSSFSKDLKSNYNNYFKSIKNGNAMFSSPKKTIEQNQKYQHSHSGVKMEKENDFNLYNQHSVQQIQQQKLSLKKQDYLLNIGSLSQQSPIVQCRQSPIEEIHNLSSEPKFQDLQTRRIPKNIQVKPFPTAFYLIQQFCLIIADYLRDQEQTSQIFLEKLKGLKFFKIQKVFREWEQIQFESTQEKNNQRFVQMIIKENYQRPVILTNSQKKMLLQYAPLRVFLHQNEYTDNQIFAESSPQNIYIRFIFDVFEQSIYQSFIGYNIKNIHMATLKQKKGDFDYLRIILSEAITNIFKSAQMLCGSFQTDDMTQYEKAQRQLINQQRNIEMTNQFQPLEFSSCEMWINMLICNSIFDQLVLEAATQLNY